MHPAYLTLLLCEYQKHVSSLDLGFSISKWCYEWSSDIFWDRYYIYLCVYLKYFCDGCLDTHGNQLVWTELVCFEFEKQIGNLCTAISGWRNIIKYITSQSRLYWKKSQKCIHGSVIFIFTHSTLFLILLFRYVRHTNDIASFMLQLFDIAKKHTDVKSDTWNRLFQDESSKLFEKIYH